ncbi:MAG: type II toxin-antitoxin system PemK/MazF family toxin [Beutenbergiaceae bacterium]
MSVLNRVLRVATSLARDLSRSGRPDPTPSDRPRKKSSRSAGSPAATSQASAREVVEFEGTLPKLQYQPEPDEQADPGEVVWAWVPYDEGNGQGKDRPVLIMARLGGGYLGLQMTSKDHDRDRAAEASHGRYWIDVGAGGWDSRGRDSQVRLDRPLFLPHGTVRREGSALAKVRYDEVAAAFLALHQ